MIRRLSAQLRLRALAILVLLLALVPATSGHVAAAGDPNTVKLDILFFYQDMDPQTNYDVSGATFLTACYDSLVRAVGQRHPRIVPDLATSWSHSADGKVWTFKLRSGVKFHDGTPVNAAAVKFSFDRLFKLGVTLAGAGSDFSEIKAVQAVNPTTVRFVLAYPFSSFLTSLTTVWGIGIVSPTAVKEHATKADPLAHTWLVDHEAGSGPYMLQSYTPGQSMTLVKFPGYWGGWAGKHFSRAVIDFISQSTTQRLMLQRGDLDGTMGLSWQDMAAIAKDPTFVTREYTAQTITEIGFNTRYGPTANPLVRQALSYAWDYHGIIQGAYLGHAQVMTGVGPTGFAHFIPEAHPYTYDPQKAKALLAKAGYGHGLTLTYVYDTGRPVNLLMGEIYQADLANIGVTLKLQGVSSPTTFHELMLKPQTVPQLSPGFWTMDYPDDQQQYWYQFSTVNDPIAITNKDFTNWLLAAMKSTSNATADHYYSLVVNRVYNEALDIWAAQPDDAVALRSDIKGYQYNYLESSYDFPLYDMYRAS